MGHPKRIGNKFEKPNHPWQKDRIDSERILSKKYGLKNKKELWKMNSILKSYKDRTKKSFTSAGVQAQKERLDLIQHLKRYGLISQDNLDEVLGLPIEAVMDRRLQSVVVKRKLARSIDHARQLIVHEHIAVGTKKITSPGYMVSLDEESQVQYSGDSPYMNPDHPEKFVEKELKDAAEAKEKAARKKDVEKATLVAAEPAVEAPPIDPLEATKTEELEEAPKPVVKKEETIEEQIQEDIKKDEKVAEGKPALDDEVVEEQDTNEAEESADEEEKKGAVVENE